LLIDDQQPEVGEGDVPAEERMSADQGEPRRKSPVERACMGKVDTIQAAAQASASGRTDGDRYEFRIFGRRIGPEAAVLKAIGGGGRLDICLDCYVIVPDRADAGLKLRGGRAELKLCLGVEDGLERWHPEAAVPLPAYGGELESIFRGVYIEPPEGTRFFADTSALTRWLEAERGLRVVPLRMRRLPVLLPAARGEIGEIQFDGTRLQTLALEGTDPVSVAALVARLGLGGVENTSYPRLLSSSLTR